MTLRTLIADDEPLARERLRFLLSPKEEVKIVGECRNGREVISHLRADPVDLLLLDIQMPGKSAFDVFAEVGTGKMPMTVFVTAHAEYATHAFDVEAVDYLTKPIEAERLYLSIARAQQRLAQSQALTGGENLKSVLENLLPNPSSKRILVREGAKEVMLQLSDVEWIEAADYYSCLHVGNRKHLIRETIKQLEGKLDSKSFVRVHRSAIVNINYVRELHHEGRSDGWVILNNGTRIRMTRAGWQKLVLLSQL